ncbi:MAG: hypothetical protein IJK31_00730 [Ruminococcus sp.]|nr:hypothetical protein [Ruminococcus sp.]NLT09230.1 hypothetical protein [Ruminococcus sp.]
MGVIQVNFIIPPEIEQGLDNNTLIRYGGVVRNPDGQFVTFLSEDDNSDNNDNCMSDLKNENTKSASNDGNAIIVSGTDSIRKKLSSFLKNNKTIIAGALVVVAVAGITYVVIKNKSKNDKKESSYVSDFNKSLKRYFNEIKNANLTEKTIDALISSIDNLRNIEGAGGETITILIENSDLLIEMVENYTKKFVEANNHSFEKADDSDNEFDSIIHYLSLQKEVFQCCTCA